MSLHSLDSESGARDFCDYRDTAGCCGSKRAAMRLAEGRTMGSARPTKHVLVVEDDAATLSAYARALAGIGFIVYARLSAEEAAAREGEYKHLDLAILDVHLPGERGDEFGARLRARYPRLPIVFITADPDEERIHGCVSDAQIMGKPFDVGALMESFIY